RRGVRNVGASGVCDFVQHGAGGGVAVLEGRSGLRRLPFAVDVVLQAGNGLAHRAPPPFAVHDTAAGRARASPRGPLSPRSRGARWQSNGEGEAAVGVLNWPSAPWPRRSIAPAQLPSRSARHDTQSSGVGAERNGSRWAPSAYGRQRLATRGGWGPQVPC